MFDISNAQKELISNLQEHFDQQKIEQKRPEPTKVSFRTGMQSIDDQMRLMQHYVCECGTTMRNAEHSTTEIGNGMFSDDRYRMQCPGCGAHETVNFRMLTRYLKAGNKEQEKQEYLKSYRKYGYY